MEYELSAYYDITHGIGLVILTPYWMKYVLSEDTIGKFAEYGVNVFCISSRMEKYDLAKMAIEKIKEYFRMLELPSRLTQVGINENKLDEMARNATKNGTISGIYLSNRLYKKHLKRSVFTFLNFAILKIDFHTLNIIIKTFRF